MRNIAFCSFKKETGFWTLINRKQYFSNIYSITFNIKILLFMKLFHVDIRNTFRIKNAQVHFFVILCLS